MTLIRDESADRPAERVRTRSHRQPCAGCGQGFEPIRPHQKFCRPSCRLAAWKARPARAEREQLAFWEPDPGRPAQQPHARRSLEHVG